MKRRITALLIGTTVLITVGTVSALNANAQISEDGINWIAGTPFDLRGSSHDNSPSDLLSQNLTQVNASDQVIDHESDPAVETRHLQTEFRNTNLTPEQFEQVRQARRRFRAELRQIMTVDLGSLLQLVFLPQAQADQQAGQVFGNSIANYSAAVSQILTPEQLKIWQQNLERSAQQ